MDFKDLGMNAKDLTKLLKAFILALDEVLDFEALGKATIKHYGPTTDDQLESVKAFILEMKENKINESELDQMFQEFDVEDLCKELLRTETEPAEEPEEE